MQLPCSLPAASCWLRSAGWQAFVRSWQRLRSSPPDCDRSWQPAAEPLCQGSCHLAAETLRQGRRIGSCVRLMAASHTTSPALVPHARPACSASHILNGSQCRTVSHHMLTAVVEAATAPAKCQGALKLSFLAEALVRLHRVHCIPSWCHGWFQVCVPCGVAIRSAYRGRR